MADYMLLEILTKDKALVDVKGESTLKGYETHIELLSYSHGVSNPVQWNQSNNGRTSGRPNLGELTVTKPLDATTPFMNFYCAQAKNLGTIRIKLVRQDSGDTNNSTNYMTYQLDNSLISSYSVGGGGDSIPTETVTFNYSKITWTYNGQKEATGAEGAIPTSWDLATNTGTA